MNAYYNENDPKAAAWLRSLIEAKLIPAGEVDERSICNVQGKDLEGFQQVHLFAGIGGWSRALQLASWPTDVPVWTGSCPCQPFSQAGKRKGTKDARHLWPEMRRLVDECGPAIVFGEQVASKDGRLWLDRVRLEMEALGYAVGAADLCAAGVGAPHIRQRLWWVAYAESERGRGICQKLGETKGDGIREISRERAGWDVFESSSGNGRLADTERNRQHGSGKPGKRRREQPANSGESIGLEHTEGDGREQGRSESVGRGTASGCGGSDSGVGDAAIEPRQRKPGSVSGTEAEVEREGVVDGSESDGFEYTGPSLGFWSDFELIPCRDGKARRIEPGLVPLVDGIPGRVAQLRGLGNAIVPQVAAEFIKSFSEVISLEE